MKLNKKGVKNLKRTLITGILSQMNNDVGYEAVLWDSEIQERELLVVDRNTEYIPVHWHAGISGTAGFRFGYDLSRIEFASEEAKRKVRDMFPAQANLITWAWYN